MGSVRQSMHAWLRRYQQEGITAPEDRPHRVHHQLCGSPPRTILGWKRDRRTGPSHRGPAPPQCQSPARRPGCSPARSQSACPGWGPVTRLHGRPLTRNGLPGRNQITLGDRDQPADCGLQFGLAAGPRRAGGWDNDAVDGLALPPGSRLQVFTAEERPGLWAQANDRFAGTGPSTTCTGTTLPHTSASSSPGSPGSRCWSRTASRTGWSAAAGPSRYAGTAPWLTCRPASTRPGCAR